MKTLILFSLFWWLITFYTGSHTHFGSREWKSREKPTIVLKATFSEDWIPAWIFRDVKTGLRVIVPVDNTVIEEKRGKLK
jgi:hypothetical protein